MSRSSSLASYVSRPVIIPFQKRTFINFFLPRNLLQRNRRAGSEFIDQKQQNKSRPKKNDQSLALAKNLSKLLRVSGAFKIENDESFKTTKLFKFFCPTAKKSRYDPKSHLLKRALPAFEDRTTGPTAHVVRPSLNYAVMQYLLSTKNKMNFDPVLALNNFVAPGVLEPTMKISNAQYGKGKSFDKRIRSRIAFFPY